MEWILNENKKNFYSSEDKDVKLFEKDLMWCSDFDKNTNLSRIKFSLNNYNFINRNGELQLKHNCICYFDMSIKVNELYYYYIYINRSFDNLDLQLKRDYDNNRVNNNYTDFIEKYPEFKLTIIEIIKKYFFKSDILLERIK